LKQRAEIEGKKSLIVMKDDGDPESDLKFYSTRLLMQAGRVRFKLYETLTHANRRPAAFVARRGSAAVT